MEKPFDISAWRPTKPPDPPDSPQEQEQKLENTQYLIAQLVMRTRAILDKPYDADNWLRRADTLARLQYPELAVGDAHKAELLCRKALADLDRRPDHRLGYRMGFWLLDEAHGACWDDEENEALQIHLTKLQSQARQIQTENMYFWPEHDEVRIVPQQYPWLQAKHQTRSDKLMAKLNQEFTENPIKTHSSKPFCELRGDAFDAGKASSDVLGVFATCDITDDTLILTDISRTLGCIGTGRDGRLCGVNGSNGCQVWTHPNLESDPVEFDLRWIRDRVGKNAPNSILQCRLLLCCIEDGVSHPLEHSLVARLTPVYHRQKPRVFSLEADYAVINEALQQFGIDIYANRNFDTWVLFTLQARIENNSWSSPTATCLNPLFSLFNHSCEPNVKWNTQSDHRTIKMKASRYIKKGEQLFVEYDGFVSLQPLEDRRKRLRRWIDGPCQCTRCVREEKDQLEQAESGGSVSSSDSSNWDTGDKPVFPEDKLRRKLH